MSKVKTVPVGDDVHPLANCKPRGDRVVIKRDEKAKQTASGIHLPDTNKGGKQQTGTVIAVGPKVDGLSVGDRVVIAAYAGIEVNQASKPEEYILVKDEDVMAFVGE